MSQIKVTGYSERGALNALLYEIAYSKRACALLEQFLSLAHFPRNKKIGSDFTKVEILIEQSLSDFGDADAILLLNSGDGKTAVFLEAKIKPAQTRIWTLKRQFELFQQGCRTERKLS